MHFIPVGDRVVLEIIEESKTTAGGLFIPDSAEDKPSRGTIIHGGDTGRFKAGCAVLFGKYAGTTVFDGYRNLLIVSVKDILAVIEGEK